ncbi:DUF1874 domain-containing protein [Pseudoalteromonas sp. McH1-7]|uniref:YddF family protein n=1 Tax=Pseudoalteromonas sp. McH1-7 TaxID=2745574 RepID=UPI0015910F5D|nr:YddF family protein [Pseudoalteromonas sp. McH1-7]NUZ10066.1 DUF1874 domain-containing protein [Pseudoalteromonas sp. McH1-7]
MKLALLNTSIATADGSYELKTISLEEARLLVAENKDNLDSAIGHKSTSEAMTELLGVRIDMCRQEFKQQCGQSAIVFKLKGRPPEGAVLSKSQIDEIGYEFKLLTKL